VQKNKITETSKAEEPFWYYK